MKVVGLPNDQYAMLNIIYINPNDAQFLKSKYIEVGDKFVYTYQTDALIPQGSVGLSAIQRRILLVPLGTNIKCINFSNPAINEPVAHGSCRVDLLSNTQGIKKFNMKELHDEIIGVTQWQILTAQQIFLIKCRDVNLKVQVTGLDMSADSRYGLISPQTTFEITSGSTLIKLEIDSQGAQMILKMPKIDPIELGIGGLNTEFINIVRRTLNSRIFPKDVVQGLGITHVKGIILYGPPGTGKTLMARTIARMLNCQEPKIVTGPELFNKYVGETESNIRKLFADAEKEYTEQGEDSQLHIIVIDEIDALCAKRGTHNNGTNVGDNAVDQLLAKIDGVTGLNNVLIIGMTNRLDMIDEAILRPGRLEVQIEVGLPDMEGRLQILKIHTKKMLQSKYLADDIDLNELATRTKNFTGAELAGLVKNACSYAMMAKINFQDLHQIEAPRDLKITRNDFECALTEIKPAFGIDDNEVHQYLPHKTVSFSSVYDHICSEMGSYFKQLVASEDSHLISLLISGVAGSGKTSLTVKLALESNFPFIKIICPNNLVRYTLETQKYNRIVSIFEDAYKSQLSVIILDDLEDLIEYVSIGQRFSNQLLQLLKTLIKKPPTTSKLLIVGTTRDAALLEEMSLSSKFDAHFTMPTITTKEELMTTLSAFDLPTESINLMETNTYTHMSTIKEVKNLVDRVRYVSNKPTTY